MSVSSCCTKPPMRARPCAAWLREQPDLILLDNHLPGVRGVDAIAGLKEVAPDVKILMLTVSENEQDLSAALKAGADGYLLKTINAEDLSDSILKVLDGDSVVSPEMTSKLVAAFRGSAATQAGPARSTPTRGKRPLRRWTGWRSCRRASVRS
jgi:two-component system nitrate/nitrite response regulator NarL